MNKKKIYVFIFARSGSKGIKNKNLKKIKDKSLLELSINTAKKINPDKIFISSDSKKIEAIAKKNKVDFINRPKKLCSDKSPEILSWKHAINCVGINFDIFISLPTTAPLRSISDIKKCIQKKINKKNDIVVCITKSKKSPYFNMVTKKNNSLKKIINSDISRRQDCPISYDLTTISYVTTPNYILKSNNIFAGLVHGVEVPYERSIDIDDKYDLEYARFLMSKL